MGAAWNCPSNDLLCCGSILLGDQHGYRDCEVVHTADSGSIFAGAGRATMAARSGGAGLEPTTLVAYGIYVNRHITPRIGATKLSQLTVPAAHAFEDQLRKGKLKVGVNIPSLDEIRAIIAVLT